MVYSENYNFALPEDEDNYDISPLSENFETLDGILSENESAVGEINDKIGTPTENGQTLFSLLENNNTSRGLTAIKSIQYVTKSFSSGTTSATVEIKPVETANCIVIFERLRDNSSGGCDRVSYKLNAASITLTHEGFSGEVGFWIIEFC